MARVVYTPEALEERRAMEFERWVGPAKKKRKANPSKAYQRAVLEAEAMKSNGGFGDAEPKHFVGLYASLHRAVYGVPPYELEGDAYFAAVRAASKLVRDEFAGSNERMTSFLRWVWSRELARERKRGPKSDGFRVGWRLQFASKQLLTDYRVEAARAGKGRKP